MQEMEKSKRNGNQSILGPEHPKLVAGLRKAIPDDLLRHSSPCSPVLLRIHSLTLNTPLLCFGKSLP